MAKEPSLEGIYRYYNRLYFKGRLPNPPDIDIRWSDRPSRALLGYQQGDEIVLNRRFKAWPSVWRMTLLHEIVHLHLEEKCIKEKKHHGEAFQKEMLKLAKKGAFDNLW